MNVTLFGTTEGRINQFNLSASGAGCRATSTAPDVVYRLVVPAQTRVSVSVDTTWDLSLNAIAAPASNCGALIGMWTQGMVCDASSDRVSSGTERLTLDNASNTDRVWFLVIDGFALSSGTLQKGAFTLLASAVARPAGPTELEPNDTRVLADATGQVLTPGTPLNAELSASEADLFRVNVTTAGVLRLEAKSFDCDVFQGTVQLSLLDAAAAVISTERNLASAACMVMVANVQPGTYYVSVARTATGTSFPYWLTSTLTTARTTESEPNDTGNQANLLTGTDAVVCGVLSASGDVIDTYLFTLPQAGRLHAEVIEAVSGGITCESSALDPKLELLSGAGLVLDSDTISGRGLCSRVEAVLMPGTYLLRISESLTTARSGFPYCLSVHLD